MTELNIFELRKIDGQEVYKRLLQDGFSLQLVQRFGRWKKYYSHSLELFHRKLYAEAVSGVDHIFGKNVWEQCRKMPKHDDKAHNFDNRITSLAIAVFTYKFPEFQDLFDRRKKERMAA